MWSHCEGWDISLRHSSHSIRVKLFRYFTLFAAGVLSLLWVLQTVLLQSAYEGMMRSEVDRVADKLANASPATDFETLLDQTAYQNNMLVYLVSENREVLYATDEHMSARRQPEPEGRGAQNRIGRESVLPADYETFRNMLAQSENGRISYTLASDAAGARALVLGVQLEHAVLYISTPLDPLNLTIDILRRQLLYVSIGALAMGLIIAYWIARRFTRPVAAITTQAGALAEGRFPAAFDKGFCSELDDLSDTLTYASHELSKVEGLRRELIANVSHDLRTPLTMIKAYTELIRDISGDDKARREQHLRVIAAEEDRLVQLVNDILVLSEVQAGSASPVLAPLDLSAAVEQVMARFEPLFVSEGYAFRAEITPGLFVIGDSRRLDQVMYNLIGNAMNYIGQDRMVGIRVAGSQDAVRVEVSDHGAGISQDDLPLIWERYYRARDHVRDKAGTGLGLAIVKGILEMHQARYGVQSRLGEGTTFWFALPRVNSPAKA